MAACLYRALLDHTLREASASGLSVTLLLAEPPVPGQWHPPPHLAWELQAPGDLGAKLSAAFASARASGWSRVMAIGSDAPGLRRHHLLWAAHALETAPAVIGPAADGGFWLLGLSVPAGELLSDIPWSSPRTRSALETRLRHGNLRYVLGPCLRDVDTFEDLAAAWEEGAFPETAAQVLGRTLGLRW